MTLRDALAAVLCALSIGGAAVAGAGESKGAAAESKPRSDAFWEKREASYREDPRGPFTAIRADYLKPGETLTLYALADSVAALPLEGGASVTISLAAGGTFTTRPAQPVDDLRLGRFLLSTDMQTPDLGRVIIYDAKLLESHFHGFPVFPDDPAFRILAKAGPADGADLAVGTTRGLEKSLRRTAILSFEKDGVACRLTGFREPGETGALFVPFRDSTSGNESYGVGRYLRVEWNEGQTTATIDFNHATNPWCAYSSYYNCILPPEENHLEVAIRAGERAPEGHP